MRISQSYLFVFLLASLTVSCSSKCPTSDDPSLPAYRQPGYHECTKLYSVFEAGLINNQDNLFQLHDTFFPSSSSEPTFAKVSFFMEEINKRTALCCFDTCWTSSRLLKSVNPSVLSTLQLQLLNLLLQTVGATELTGLCVHLDFKLKGKLNFAVTYIKHADMMHEILQDLTSWLKVYASTQRSRSSWNAADLQYQGYYNSCDSDWTLVYVLVSIAVLIVALTTIVLFKVAPKIYWKAALRAKRGNQWYSFFWAASFMASLCNSALLLGEVIPGIYNWSQPSLDWEQQHSCSNETLPFLLRYIIKVAVMLLLIPLDILVTICIPKSVEFPIPYLAYIFSFPLCCTCCCRTKQLCSKWIQTLALTSLLLFAQFIALSALSTIMWAFVFPVQTLSVITFFAAAIFCVTSFIALLLRDIGQLTCSRNWRDNWNTLQPLLILMVTLFLVIVILTSYVYIKFITSGIDTNQVGGSLVSFLPSAILTILGWFVTKGKCIEQLFPRESDSTRNRSQLDPPTERTPLIMHQPNV